MKILIVDDDLTTLVLLKNFLESEKHNVSTATNAQEAINKLSKVPYDLLITDMLIPYQNQIDVFATDILQYLHDNKLTLKVIAITAGGNDYGPQEYLELAKKFYPTIAGTLKKPILKQDLIGLIDKIFKHTYVKKI